MPPAPSIQAVELVRRLPERTRTVSDSNVTGATAFLNALIDLHFSSFESMLNNLSVCNFLKVEKVTRRNKRYNQITDALEQFYFLGDSRRKKDI